jgi:hypothetical protein
MVPDGTFSESPITVAGRTDNFAVRYSLPLMLDATGSLKISGDDIFDGARQRKPGRRALGSSTYVLNARRGKSEVN